MHAQCLHVQQKRAVSSNFPKYPMSQWTKLLGVTLLASCVLTTTSVWAATKSTSKTPAKQPAAKTTTKATTPAKTEQPKLTPEQQKIVDAFKQAQVEYNELFKRANQGDETALNKIVEDAKNSENAVANLFFWNLVMAREPSQEMLEQGINLVRNMASKGLTPDPEYVAPNFFTVGELDGKKDLIRYAYELCEYSPFERGPRCALLLGKAYEYEYDVVLRDLDRAAFNYKLAVDAGLAEGYYQLAGLTLKYHYPEDKKYSLQRLLTESQNFLPSLVTLALNSNEGVSAEQLKQLEQDAKSFDERAVARNFYKTSTALGDYYLYMSAEKPLEEQIEYFKQASQAGSPYGLNVYANYLIQHNKVESLTDEQVAMLKLAADYGDPNSKYVLGYRELTTGGELETGLKYAFGAIQRGSGPAVELMDSLYVNPNLTDEARNIMLGNMQQLCNDKVKVACDAKMLAQAKNSKAKK